MDTRAILDSLLTHGEDTWLDWKSDLPAGLISGKGPGWEEGRAELLKDLVSIANGSDGNYGDMRLAAEPGIAPSTLACR
jgi:hypothetical protein